MSPSLLQVRLMSTGNEPSPVVLLMSAVRLAVPPDLEMLWLLYVQPLSMEWEPEALTTHAREPS